MRNFETIIRSRLDGRAVPTVVEKVLSIASQKMKPLREESSLIFGRVHLFEVVQLVHSVTHIIILILL